MDNYTYEISYRADEADPRQWGNLGCMVTWHRKYNLGDDQPQQAPDEWLKEFNANNSQCEILPLYLYDHSGITMSTMPFSCQWDSGQIGYIYTTIERVRELGFNWKRLNTKRRAKIIEWLEAEVEAYDQYITGEVYCFKLLDADGVEVDSGYGYYDRDECEAAAQEAVSWHENNNKKTA
jgi:hypothetical protein